MSPEELHQSLTQGMHPIFKRVLYVKRDNPLEDATLGFLITDSFICNYLGLDEHIADRSLAALQTIRISRVRIAEFPSSLATPPRTRSEVQRCNRLRRLWQALGNNPTLKNAFMDVLGNELWSIAHACALQELRQIQALSICMEGDARNLQDLVNGLRGHGSLRAITLEIPMEEYPTILPVLPTLPELNCVTIDASPWESAMTPAAAQAIANLFLAEMPHLSIKMNSTDIDEECQTILCQGIARANVAALNMFLCLVEGDPVQFANAITSSRLTDVCLMYARFNDGIASFLRPLAAGLDSMPRLERFTCRPDFHFESGTHIDDAMLSVAGVLARCPRIALIELLLDNYSDYLDRIMADCVRSCPCLETLVMDICDSRGEDCAFPLLLISINNNYSLTKVTLKMLPLDMRAKVDAICKLNKAGRKYMALDSANQQKAICVLAAVNDDLDCLFTHLRENPLACRRVSIGATATRRKRKAANLNVKDKSHCKKV
ncbi:hypothetical protein MPSEU_000869000 [Mayamaea pseudoterrestris]|nr:hypothetical protein MPSEU_000869000 [Mayamaea pseudoterrestris]